MPPLLAAAIPAVMGLIQQLIHARQTRRNVKHQEQSNRRLAEYSYQKDFGMAQYQNEYNSPASQMQRYRDASLNPHLIYGQGTPGNMSDAPAYKQAVADYSGVMSPDISPVGGVIGNYQDYKMRQAQIDNVNANTQATKQKTINESFREWLLALQGKTAEFDLDRRKALAPYQEEVAKGEARKVQPLVDQEFTKMMTLRREELIKMLEAQSKEKQLTQQDLDAELKRAELLFKKFENMWRQQGVTSADNPILRMLIRWATENGINLLEAPKELINKFRGN